MTTLRSVMRDGYEVLIELLRDLFLRREADDLIRELAVLEESSVGMPRIMKRPGTFGFSSTFILATVDAPVVFRRKRVDGRRQAPARAAPFRPEVDEHDAVLRSRSRSCYR